MSELKVSENFVFDDGQLRVKTKGWDEKQGWGEIIFNERQLEYTTEEGGTFVSVEIPPSELKAIRDFLNRLFPPHSGPEKDDGR